MLEKQKPQPDIFKIASKAFKNPETATKREIKSMAARVLELHGMRTRRPIASDSSMLAK